MDNINGAYYSDPKLFWKLIKQNNSSNKTTVNPLRDPQTQELVCDTTQSLKIWAEYFTGLSRQEQIEDHVFEANNTQIDASEIYISAEDVQRSLRTALDWKAPGPDGFTNEMLRGALRNTCVLNSVKDLLQQIQKLNYNSRKLAKFNYLSHPKRWGPK